MQSIADKYTGKQPNTTAVDNQWQWGVGNCYGKCILWRVVALVEMSSRDVHNYFDKLPDDILLNIFHNLTDFDLSVVRKVCQRFESVGKDRELIR